MNHLQDHHGMDVRVSDMTCPLCVEFISGDRGDLSLHIARHMEEVALAVLPSGVESDEESVDESTSESASRQHGDDFERSEPRKLLSALLSEETFVLRDGNRKRDKGEPVDQLFRRGPIMNTNQRQANQDFDFTEIANRQMEAMRSQDQGTTVVPASNNPNNGGLNLPQGAQQPSPGMPMLNRSMPPPGQPGPPGTPQQRPPQAHVPIMTPQPGQADPNLSELMRQAQQRAAAVQQANQQPLTDQVRMSMMPPDLDASVKQQLLKVPEHQFRVILQSYMMNLRRNSGMPNGAFPPGQPNADQPHMGFDQQQPLQPGVAGQMLGGPNMQGMVRPGMNLGQPPPGAVPQVPVGAQRGPMPTQQQRVAAASNLLRANPGIITITDPKPFPPNVLNAQIRQSLPPDVRT